MSLRPEVEQRVALDQATSAKINVYCRVLELHLRAIAEGASPYTTGLKEPISLAMKGLTAELQFLAFLRDGGVVPMASADVK